MNIIIQIIGFLGMGANVLSFQFKKHKYILLFRTINEMLFIIQYFLLSAWSGAFLNIVGCVRNIIFSHQVERAKSTTSSVIMFCVLFSVFGILTFEGVKSIMLIFAKLFSTIAYGNTNTKVIRVVSFLTHVSYLFYNLSVLSLAGALSDVFLLVSLVVAIVRFDIYPQINKNKI